MGEAIRQVEAATVIAKNLFTPQFTPQTKPQKLTNKKGLALIALTLCFFFAKYGSACWTRTSDPLINSQLLYRLS